ncbi:MAG: T9SS type A sorting domain-containing protein [Bacteroidetes bacterium]|nr:MAG: T9SS type A sorting domain-containing protein [Bacteroidota bacterium]
MKALITLTATLLSISLLRAQAWDFLPQNAQMNSSVYDVEMVSGNVFQIYYQNNQGNNELIVDMYDAKTQSWRLIDVMNVGVVTRVKTEQRNGIIYVAYSDANGFNFVEISASSPQLTPFANSYSFTNPNKNWDFHAGKNPGEYYVLFTSGTGPSMVHGIEFVTATNDWLYMEENSSQDLSLARTQIASSDTDVYFGVYSTKVRLTRFIKGDITTMFAYDGGSTGEVMVDGAAWNRDGFLLVGNKNNNPFFYGTEDANNLSYQAPLDGNTISINTATAPTTGFNLDTLNMIKESGNQYAYILSRYSADGLGNPNNVFQLIKKDITQGASAWDNYGPELESPGTDLESHSLRLGVTSNGNHLVASYNYVGDPTVTTKVLNIEPYAVTATLAANSGLCAGQMNEIYGQLEIMDDDLDRVYIIGTSSANATTTNITVVPNGFENGVSKFKIYGMVGSGSDEINITFTDGYSTRFATLGTFTGNTTPLNLAFESDPVKLCTNEKQVDLSELVNYYDGGIFRVNGQIIDGTNVDASALLISNGSLKYTVNVNGCIVATSANYNLLAPPSMTTSTTPSNCAQATGTATLNVVAGASANISTFWSTGEETTTISNLDPGAYYAYAFDDNGCRATALASVESGEISITETLVNPSCHNSKDGSIDISVSGITDYQIVWSTGQFGPLADQLGGGSYEFTLYSLAGCEIKRSYKLIAPEALAVDFTTLETDCGLQTGSVVSSVSGGTGNYVYNWSPTGGASPSITNVGQGMYVLEVTDENDCMLRDSVFVNEKLGAIISDSIILADCGIDNGGIDISVTPAPQGDPVKSVSWSNGETSEDLFNVGSGDYTVSVLTTANCLSQKSFHIGIRAPQRNDICVVTVDEETTTNLIVWEKPETDQISHYNIYRENSVAGEFMLIDTVQYTNLSVFNDVIASPLQRSWRYRIAAVNFCDVHGPLSPIHKTLHLNTISSATPGVIDVYWDDYEGIGEGDYVVHRFTDQNGWEVLSPSVPFGNQTKFSDTPPGGATGLDYLVTLDLAAPCTATYRAQDFNTSRSNKQKGLFNPGEGTGNSNNEVIQINGQNGSINVYPNPFGQLLVVELEDVSKAEIEIRDVQGKLINHWTCFQGQNEINTEQLSPGIYFVSTMVDGVKHTIKISK